jgi:hypothetical protein
MRTANQRVLVAIVAVMVIVVLFFLLGRNGSRIEKTFGTAFAQIFPSRTPAATLAYTPSRTLTITQSPTVTPTPTCDELATQWALMVFYPAYKEFTSLLASTNYREWAVHHDAILNYIAKRGPPSCQKEALLADSALRYAVKTNEGWFPDYLTGCQSSGYAFLHSSIPRKQSISLKFRTSI